MLLPLMDKSIFTFVDLPSSTFYGNAGVLHL